MHTKEPWEIADEPSVNIMGEELTIIICGADGFPVAEFSYWALLPDYRERLGVDHWSGHEGTAYIDRPAEEVLANAKRAVAAMRSVRGIPTEALESGVIQDVVEGAEGLLLALENTMVSYTDAVHVFKPLKLLEAALAKLRGEEKEEDYVISTSFIEEVQQLKRTSTSKIKVIKHMKDKYSLSIKTAKDAVNYAWTWIEELEKEDNT